MSIQVMIDGIRKMRFRIIAIYLFLYSDDPNLVSIIQFRWSGLSYVLSNNASKRNMINIMPRDSQTNIAAERPRAWLLMAASLQLAPIRRRSEKTPMQNHPIRPVHLKYTASSKGVENMTIWATEMPSRYVNIPSPLMLSQFGLPEFVGRCGGFGFDIEYIIAHLVRKLLGAWGV